MEWKHLAEKPKFIKFGCLFPIMGTKNHPETTRSQHLTQQEKIINAKSNRLKKYTIFSLVEIDKKRHNKQEPSCTRNI